MSMPPGLAERYATIAAAQPQQEAKYAAWIASDEVNEASLTAQAAAVGLTVDVPSGHLSLGADFEAKRLPLCFDLIYCRHGKTTGNTEPRVYQGYVDEPNNALNDTGKQQAEDAADKLDGMQLTPDLIVLSPLSRAAETGRAYANRHAELAAKTEEWDDSAEMRFGAWDNKMVKDLEDDNICHLFYLAQNAVVKTAAPYRDPASGKEYAAESFVEVLTRMNGVLARLNERMAVAAEGRRPLVVMYGHSMCGAALAILTGNGKQVDGESYLGFDGKYIMPNATPVFLHKA